MEGLNEVGMNWNGKVLVRCYFRMNCGHTYLFLFFFFLGQAAIRKELNEFKSKEMEVHEESKQFTR